MKMNNQIQEIRDLADKITGLERLINNDAIKLGALYSTGWLVEVEKTR